MGTVSGCERRHGTSAKDGDDAHLTSETVATVGGALISVQAFEREWRRNAGALSKEEVLKEMVRFEAMLFRARAAGLDRDPELVAAFNRLLVSKFEENQLNTRGGNDIRISEPEIQSYYETHGERFSNPARLRLGIIARQTSGTKASSEKRDASRHEAERLWHEARQATDEGFHTLALKHSDNQATRYAGGDTGWFLLEPENSQWDPAVLLAASALTSPGEMAPLIETSRGFYIVKLIGKQPSNRRPLAEVRDAIEYHLRQQKAQSLRVKFSEEMQTGLAIHINRHALAAVPDTSGAHSSRPPTPMAQ